MKIYKITKPGTNEVYIGQTSTSLKRRFANHKMFAKKRESKVYKWFDNNCIIELIEEFEGEKDLIKEMNYVEEYTNNGFIIMNTKIGVYTLDPANYVKNMNAKFRPKHNSNRHPDYNNWCSNINYKAKKEKLTSKEYRLKYNIPDYTGPKTKN